MIRHPLKLVASLLVLVLLTGCNKDQVTDAIDKGTKTVKETAQKTTETIKEKANLAGSMELVMGSPVAVGRCYVSLVTPAAGQPSVFQITSYRDATDESFPSVFFRGQVSATSLSELSGKTIAGTLHVQNEEEGTVWQSTPGTQVEVLVSTASKDEVVGQFVTGNLTETDEGQSVDVTGKFNGPTL